MHCHWDEWACFQIAADIIDIHGQSTRAQIEYKTSAEWCILPSVSLFKKHIYTVCLKHWQISNGGEIHWETSHTGSMLISKDINVVRHFCGFLSAPSHRENFKHFLLFHVVVGMGLQCSTMRKPDRARALHSSQWLSAVPSPSGTAAMMYEPPFMYNHVPLRKTSAYAIHVETLLAAGWINYTVKHVNSTSAWCFRELEAKL